MPLCVLPARLGHILILAHWLRLFMFRRTGDVGEVCMRLLPIASQRLWLLLPCVLVCLAETALARSAGADSDSGKAGGIRWGVMSASAALLAQMLLDRQSRCEQDGAANTDEALTWREDEGLSKLVPLHPSPRSAEGQSKLASYTMAQVAARNTSSELWVAIDGYVYDLTRFVLKHPGGALPIMNMAGKDCTDVFANYHPARVYKTMLPAYLIGQVSDYQLYPHVAEFRAIRQELLRRGLFETDLRFYAKLGAFLAFLFCTALWLTLSCSSTVAHAAGAAVMGIFWQQLAGVGHDLGHSGVSHRFKLDHLVGSTVGNALMGISTGWWKQNHNTHHVVCNSVENDPDIQHMPILAVSNRVFERPYWSSYYSKWVQLDAASKFLVGHQHILFYPLMMVARFNLYAQSWIMVLSKQQMHYRKTEAAALTLYAAWVLALALSLPTWGQTAMWLLVSHATAGLLHVQIVISHWAMETYHGHAYNDETDEWFITQLKTTMNVATPPLLDWVHIGLQFQIEHHLFPRLPRHNLRKARELVRPLCAKHGIHYHEPSFWQANVETLRALRSAAFAARESGARSMLWEAMNALG
uniref:Cytochrome b5 heme-binding domain-containing protein n=1 Tax=Chrysotila carterae TaxID=13221 RepID=A0A7S4B931_CHRCT